MAIGKPRGKNGARPVYVYDPREGRKVYVGSRFALRGPDGAQALEREKQEEFARLGAPAPTSGLTVAAYAQEWLRDHHGEGTRRPARSTYAANENALRPFLDTFGGRELDGGVERREALRWSKQHAHNAKVVAAMYADGMDDEACKSNPFAHRRQAGSRERKHIHPLTEAEIVRLGDIAERHWSGYGPVAKAWTLFGAWVGCRPGETFRVSLDDLDFDSGTATIRRVKRRGGEYPVDVVVLPEPAIIAVKDAQHLLSGEGAMFRTIRGKLIEKGALRYLWDPIRSAFRETVTEERWTELLDGTEDGKNLDFYALRHFCASMIVARGGNEYDVSAQLGNSPEVARDTYIHSYREERNARNRGFLNRPAPVADLVGRRERKTS